ncbi:hypothetical protein WJX73_000018, partial [Symbiochloris irregularis]
RWLAFCMLTWAITHPQSCDFSSAKTKSGLILWIPEE